MDGSERRRHVRTKPLAEYPLHAVLRVGPHASVATVADVSVGGVALSSCGGLEVGPSGSRVKLQLEFATLGAHTVEAIVRHRRDSVVGLEFVDVSEKTASTVQRYVAELLERGARC